MHSCWLPCGDEWCDGSICVEYEIEEGRAGTRDSPPEMAEAIIQSVVERDGCRTDRTPGAANQVHVLTDRDLDRLEREEQQTMIEAAERAMEWAGHMDATGISSEGEEGT